MSIHLSSPDSLFRFIHPRVSVKLRSLAGASLIPAAIAAVVAGSPVAPALADNAPQTTPAKPAGSSAANVTLQVNPDSNDADRPDSQRVSDSYQPKGIDFGDFLFLPKIEFGETYNSNVYGSQVDVRGDFLSTIRSELNLRSQFSEHQLNFSLVGEEDLYKTYSRDDQTNLTASVDGHYDYSKDTRINLSSQAFSSHEARSSPNTIQGEEPTPIQGILNRANIEEKSDRFSFLGEVETDRLTFDDVKTSIGSLIPNTDRNRWELSVRERGAYEMFPGYAAVLQVTENTHIFDKTLDRDGYDRGSSGYRAEAGVGIDLTHVIRGDFLLGSFQQFYHDSRLATAGGLSMRAVFNWTPSKLTIIIPSIDRSIFDTTTTQASAYDRSALTVTVRHELERNIVVTGFGGLYYDQLTGVQNQNDMTYEARAKVIYAFTPELYVGGEVGFLSRRSEAQLQSFDQLTTMVKLGVQY